MTVFDTATPTGSEAISSGDDRIRELKLAIEDFLRGGAAEGTEAIFPGSAPTTAPVYRYRGLKGTTVARPSAGQYGFYFDTTRNVFQRDNGTTWDDIGTNLPAGTVMLFAQASAPTGWTKLTTYDDRALRVVAGSTGGSGGGSLGVSGGVSHSHTVTAHHHAISSAAISHKHLSPAVYSTATSQINGVAENPFGTGGDATSYNLGTFAARVGPQGSSVFEKTDVMSDYAAGNTDDATPTTDTQAPVIAYYDVLAASKD